MMNQLLKRELTSSSGIEGKAETPSTLQQNDG